MIVGYARTSTHDQKFGLVTQRDQLSAAGCDKIFFEHASASGKRSELQSMLGFVRQGDTVVVTKLDRLARSASHLWTIVEDLTSREVELRILDIALDTGTATGKLMLSLLGAVSQFEREVMLERQKEGIAKAMAVGKRFGRKPLSNAVVTQIRELRANGHSVKDITAKVGVSRASVYRAFS